MHPMLVTTEELDAMLDRDDVVVVDVRSKMAFMASGHILHAVAATWHDFSDPNSAIKGFLDPDIGRLEKKLGALGISNDRQVVVYSNPFDNWGDEGRMYWTLKYLGHPNVRVLDGGWVKWSAEMRRFECGPANPRPAMFKATVDPSLITNKADVRKLVEESPPDTILADARSTEEYNGAFQQGIARGGHIPSAVNVPWNQFFNPDGTVKPVDAIRAILEKQGVTSGQEVVCYCTGGVRSAWLYFIMKLAGYEKVKNYPGSWWEWGNDYTLPVVNLKEQQRPPVQRTMPNKPPTAH
jgi:thiosulfate/3-mercaptopyruvate sulfurtransferase